LGPDGPAPAYTGPGRQDYSIELIVEDPALAAYRPRFAIAAGCAAIIKRPD
jgi:hypothetical protein